jgi:hypothetical protein
MEVGWPEGEPRLAARAAVASTPGMPAPAAVSLKKARDRHYEKLSCGPCDITKRADSGGGGMDAGFAAIHQNSIGTRGTATRRHEWLVRECHDEKEAVVL